MIPDEWAGGIVLSGKVPLLPISAIEKDRARAILTR